MKLKKSLIVVIHVIIVSVLSAGEIESSRRLTGIARSLWSPVELQSKGMVKSEIDKEQTDVQVRQAVVWLEAADRLDGNNKYVLSDLEYLYRSEMIDDPGRAMNVLTRYSELQPEDNICVSGWMDYCLEKLDQQKQRESFINSMLENLREYPSVQSDMITLLGVYATQQGELDRAAASFEYAWKVWPYNLDAGMKILAMPLPRVDDPDNQMSSSERDALTIQIEQNRRFISVYYLVTALQCDPSDFDSALEFADMLFDLNKFDYAKRFYDHCLALIKADKDQNILPADITGLRLKRAVSAYNSGNYDQSLQTLAEILKESSPADVPSAAFTVMAMKKMGKLQEAQTCAQSVLTEIEAQVPTSGSERQRDLDLAWFYAFALDDDIKALEYARHAGSDDEGGLPSILGYLEVKTGTIKTPDEFGGKYTGNTPLLALALANLHADIDENDVAYEICQRALNSAPGSIYIPLKEAAARFAEKAGIKEPAGTQDVIDTIVGRFDFGRLGLALAPEKFIQCNIQASRKLYEYTEDIIVDLSVTNISSQELPLGQQMYFDPYVYCQATVTPKQSGVKSEPVTIPLGLCYLAQRPLLRSGFSNSWQEILNAGRLADMLNSTPQLGYEITLTCVPMPCLGKDGEIIATYPTLTCRTEPIERQAFSLTPQRLSLYYNMLQNGRDDERVEAIGLFTGLLKEAIAARNGKLAYKPQTVDYNKAIAAVLANLQAENPQVRAWTAWSLDGLLSDKKVVDALTVSLKDKDWFVRLMTLNTMRKSVKIDTVIDWFSKNETDPTVLRQIELWQGKAWTTEPLPFELVKK